MFEHFVSRFNNDDTYLLTTDMFMVLLFDPSLTPSEPAGDISQDVCIGMGDG